jgi:hypothetical protein
MAEKFNLKDFETPEDVAWLARRVAEEERHGYILKVTEESELHALAKTAEKQLGRHFHKRARSNVVVADGADRTVTGEWITPSADAQGRTRFEPPLVASSSTWRDAVALLDAIAKGAESRGIVVSTDARTGRFRLRLEDAEVFFAIREDVEGRHSREGSGVLRVAIIDAMNNYRKVRFYPEKKSIEICHDLFVGLYRKVVIARQEARLQNARRAQSTGIWERIRQIEEQRAVEQAQAKVEGSIQANEQLRVDSLINQARQWELATLIHRYISSLSATKNQKEKEWRAWAMDVAKKMAQEAQDKRAEGL